MIDVRNLTKLFEQPDGTMLRALDGIDLHIDRGEVVSIIGPSASGKTTLLRTLNLLDPPTSGQILIDGQDITAPDYPQHRLHQRMGMVVQQFSLFQHLDVLGNVSLAPQLVLGMTRQQAEAQAMEMLEKVSLAEKAHAMPSALSGGQQQRAAIARCLAMRPDIILFDEPLSALDPAMVGEVQGVIRLLAKEGMTMLIVTHKMRFAHDIATRTLFIDRGRIIEDGTPAQIFNHPTRPQTQAFVRRIQSLVFEIASRRFDFYDMMSQIHLFCIRFDIPEKMNTISHVVEEMLLLLSKYNAPVRIEVNHSELDRATSVVILHRGETVSPFERDDADELAVMIIRGMSKNIQTEATPEGTKLTFEM